MMKRIRIFFIRQASSDELMNEVIARTIFVKEGDHLMEDGRTVFSRAGRDPSLAEWIDRRKSNLLKYATIEGRAPVVKHLIGEYDMILNFIGARGHIPKSDPVDTTPELTTFDSVKKAWEKSPFRKL